MSPFRPIVTARSRIADEVYDQVLAAIRSGGIGPAERIVQERLGADLGVSRTPVREALLRLEGEGVLVRSGHGGFLIRSVAPAEVQALYAARVAIEGHAARLLAGRAEAIAAIEAVVQDREALRPDDPAGWYAANRDIHRAVVAGAGNPYLTEMFDLLWNRALSFAIFGRLTREDLEATLTGHMALCAAMRTGDADLAFAAMAAHVGAGSAVQVRALTQG